MNTLFQPIGYYAPVGETYMEGYMAPIYQLYAPILVDKSWADDNDQDLPALDKLALAIVCDDDLQGMAKELVDERPSTSMSTSTYASSKMSVRSAVATRRCGFCKEMGHMARWNSAVTCPSLKAKLLRQQQEADAMPEPNSAAGCYYCKEQGVTRHATLVVPSGAPGSWQSCNLTQMPSPLPRARPSKRNSACHPSDLVSVQSPGQSSCQTTYPHKCARVKGTATHKRTRQHL